jgi:uridine kinase
MAKSGVSKDEAKKVYNDVKKELENLEKYMDSLVKHVNEMNEKYWYGDDSAKKWYDTMSGHFSTNKNSLVKFYNGVAKLEEELHDIFAKAKAKGINF